MITDIEFFKQLFNKNISIGNDQLKIDNKQMISEAFAIQMLEMVESQFLSTIKNFGYSITNETNLTNIKFYIYYETAVHLITGNNITLPQGSTLDMIIQKSKEYNELVLKDINKVVKQKFNTGGTVRMNKQNLIS